MASAPIPASYPSPYWPPLLVGGVPVNLQHLEPFQVTCSRPGTSKVMVIDVTFTNHCFTDHFVYGVHHLDWFIPDHTRARVFCPIRHGDSLDLPGMVKALPTSNVHQTRHERNYVYAMTLTARAGAHYTMFFRLKRDRTKVRDIEMVVESAYAMTAPGLQETLRGASKVKFATVCDRVFRNLPEDFRHRG